MSFHMKYLLNGSFVDQCIRSVCMSHVIDDNDTDYSDWRNCLIYSNEQTFNIKELRAFIMTEKYPNFLAKDI